MIINNYNGSLPENTETNMTATKYPALTFRGFDASIKAGDNLVIPYYVSDFDQKEYRDEKLGPTFTTIFSLDEDTVPAGEVRTWKQTTYAGEQVIDLGTFDEVGIHTLNVRTIQSNGVASATKLLKFIVHPAGTKTVLDLSTLSGFSGEFTNYQKYRMMYLQEWNGIGPCLSVYNCDYAVTKTVETVDGEDKVTDIQIVVTKPTGFTGHCITNHKIDDDGNINVKNGTSIDNYLDIDQWETDGVYHIATKCIVDGATVELKDYLGVPLSQLPAAVIETAAKNKVALTRLFEAAKAWRWKQVFDNLVHELGRPTEEGVAACAVAASDAVKYEFTFKMPKMDIVCDYHYAYALSLKDSRCTVSLSDMNGLWIHREGTGTDGSGTYSQNLHKFYGRDDIMVPDGMTVDLNGTTFSMLQITNVKSGRLLHILNNVNTHVINGSFVGNYKGVEFAHTHDMETLHLLACHASLFSSFESLDISWPVGYEMHIGNDEGPQIGENDSLLIPFSRRGYIDYDGNVQQLTGTGNGWYYTEGICKVLNYGWTVCGREIRISRYVPISFGSGNNSYQDLYTNACRIVYVHFYDMAGQFIKTVKTSQHTPVLIPYGAWKMKMSMYGTMDPADKYNYLNPNDSHKFARNFCNLSWGCGIKNSKIHDTRTCTLDNGGSQTFVKNLVYWNVALERYRPVDGYDGDSYHFTRHLVDLEDDSMNLYNWWIDGLNFLFGDCNSVNIVAGFGGHMKDCKNVSICCWGDVHDHLIENSSISLIFHPGLMGVGSGSHMIIRNCLIQTFDNAIKDDAENGGRLWIRNNSLMCPPTNFYNAIGTPENEYNRVEMFDDIKL
ncbi:MAG: hypothetical protein SPL96_11145 [Bacteroidales bacterium]|nr:hypothetical protein [Bacteroidales bacterium]